MQATPLRRDATEPEPRVTVFIPAFNAERYIAEAIESVLAQTFTDFELLIVDDGSTDDTPAVIRRFSHDARLRVTTHADNLGRPRTRNHGLDLAHGEYIAFLDADDRCAPQRLTRQVAYLDAHDDIDGVGSWMAWIDEYGQPIESSFYTLPIAPEHITCQMLVECPLAQPTLLMRRTALANYRYDNDFAVSQDYELWARMITTCRFANLPEVLVYYRHHGAQATTTQNHAQEDAGLVIHGRQVGALGLRHDVNDLIRHACLFQFEGRQPVLERTGAPLDIGYLRWARAWLEALFEGNTRRGIYPEPAFSRMLAERWLFACRKAARNSSRFLVWREMLAAPLRGLVMALYKQKIRRFFTR